MRKHVQKVQQVCQQVCMVSPQVKRKVRIAYVTLILIGVLASAAIIAVTEHELKRIEEEARRSAAPPFPVSVDPTLKLITENPEVDTYFAVHISSRTDHTRKLGWFRQTIEQITQSKWFQQLASPVARVLVIHPGERKEQVADNFGDLLGWSDEERQTFLTRVEEASPSLTEGMFFPERYLTHKDATPEEIAVMVTTYFNEEVLTRYPEEVAAVIPLEQALVFASLLEREAYDFTDMREIAGIIWNRLFIDMNLQLDATLQYAKANEAEGGPWWPRPTPADKYIESPFNTYENEGLPPTPIANPSLDAILAALNPIETDCMFYFHDDYSNFICSDTYEEHVQNLRREFGQGR
ncbi:MAG: endolytic transglycosylase MltG [Candidatus Paceibacterota bacterium]